MITWADGDDARGGERTGGGLMTTQGAVVGVVGGSRSDFPILEKATALLEMLDVPLRAPGRVGASQPGSPLPVRGDGPRRAGSGSSSPAPAAPPTCRACWPPRRPCR